MIGRVPRHRSLGDDVDPGALHVFIPGALASGFLISLALLGGDAYRKIRGTAGSNRRVSSSGAAIADEVRSGAGASRTTDLGLRQRFVYGVVSLVSIALVAMVVPGATWNFLNPVGYISDIAWIWAISLLIVIGFAVLGVQTLRIVPEWAPIILIAVGVGVAVRFLFGSEPAAVRIVPIVGGLLTALVGVAAVVRSSRGPRSVDIPPSVRPLLVRTPLARSE